MSLYKILQNLNQKMLNNNNVIRYEFLKVTRAISSLGYKTEELETLEESISEKTTEILTENNENMRIKEILTILQLVLCQSECLPPFIIQELLDSLLLIINSVTIIIQSKEEESQEIKESVKTI